MPTKDELADDFTKPLLKEQHWSHMRRLGLKLEVISELRKGEEEVVAFGMSELRKKGEEEVVAFVKGEEVVMFTVGKGKRKRRKSRR